MADLVYMAKSKWRELLDTIRTKGGTSAPMTADQAIAAVEAIPSGGGGVQTIASGTFTGDGAVPPAIPVGKKMPKTDFVFNIWVDGGTEITPPSGTNRTYVWAQIVVQKRFGEYDLSTDGLKPIISKLAYPTVNTSTGVTTERKPNYGQSGAGGFVRWTVAAVEVLSVTQIARSAEGFSVKLAKGSDYTTASGVTYNWELLYIGNDPTNDIVEVP
jgi:hypothetical protein